MMKTAEAVKVENSETPEKTREAIQAELRQDFADWMTTDRDLVWRPAVELTKEDNEFAARALVPGVDSRELEILVAPKLLLIIGETHRGEPGQRKLMSSVEFPRPVNPAKVHAEIKDGVLSIRAEIAQASKADVFIPKAA